MADRKITDLSAADSTDLTNNNTLIQIVNPDRALAVDRNRKMTRTQLPDLLPDGSVTDAKLRDSSALSVIGRSANSLGDPADIAAGTDGFVLRRSGTSLGFGEVATAGIANDAVTTAKIVDGAVTAAKLDSQAVGVDPVWSADDTTGTNVAKSSSELVPAGVWYVEVGTTDRMFVEVFINAAWHTIATGGWLAGPSTALVISDGTNVRVRNSSSSTVYPYYARQVYP